MLPESLQASQGICGSGGLIVEMAAKQVDLGSRGGKPHAFVVALLVCTTTGQYIEAKSTGAGDPGVHLRRNCRSDVPRKHQHPSIREK